MRKKKAAPDYYGLEAGQALQLDHGALLLNINHFTEHHQQAGHSVTISMSAHKNEDTSMPQK